MKTYKDFERMYLINYHFKNLSKIKLYVMKFMAFILMKW